MSPKQSKIIPKVKLFINNNYYIIYVILAFISFVFSAFGFLRTIMWGILLLLNFHLLFRKKGVIDELVYLYIFFAFFSILGWFQRQYPFEFYLTILSQEYIPIIFYFIGKESSERISIFYKRGMYAFMFVIIIGLYCLYAMPTWYVEKSLTVLNQLGHYTEDTLKYARFASFLDSYHTANYSVFLLCISLEGISLKNNNLWQKGLYEVAFFLAVIGIMLSQQRVAMFVGIALIILRLFLGEKKKRFILRFALLVCLIIIGLLFLAERYSDYFSIESVMKRFSEESRSTIVSSRSGTWINALTYQSNYIWGHGLGGGGHLAKAIGIEPSITDGSYFVILLETGIFSLLTIVAILVSTLIRGFKRRNGNYVDFTIVVFSCFSLFGANTIYFPYIIGFMWYAIGRINRKN